MTKNTTMKKVEIEIPEGKKAEWVNGVLTLVDDTPKDIKERVKTFEDAVAILGDEHPLVAQFRAIENSFEEAGNNLHLFAYARLVIIAEALNEGWKPTYDKNEWRYYPWFYICTKEEYEELVKDDEPLCHVPLRSNGNAHTYGGLVCTVANLTGSNSFTHYGVRLAFKTKELAEYCGKQFIDIWTDFLFA